MNWGIEDALAAVAVLGSAIIAVGLVRRYVFGELRPVLIAGIVLATLATWAHLAVGIV